MFNKSSKRIALALTVFVLTVLSNANVFAAAEVGKPAPAFTLTDSEGKIHNLSDYKGKFVILEWTNPECPFVQKHYQSANIPDLQKDAQSKGVVWLSIDSSAPGTEGYLQGEEAKKMKNDLYKNSAALLIDSDGKVGREYGATATPHMYIIDAEGKLLYVGAIDSIPSADKNDIKKATNYVKVGLDQAMKGQPLTTASTKAYGCSVKYK